MIRYIIIVLGFLFLTLTSTAQSGAFLNRPTDARTLALGNTGLSSNATAFSIFNNTAATAQSEDYLSVGVNYLNWQPSSLGTNAITFGAYIKPMEKMSFALGVRYGMEASQEGLNDQGVVTGPFSPSDMIIDLGVAYEIFNGFSAAVNLRYINSSISTASASAFAADIQFMFKLDRLNLGLSANNFGSKLSYGDKSYPLPSSIKLGASYCLLQGEKHDVLASLEGGYILSPQSMSSVFGGIGVEYVYDSMIFVRAGYSYGDLTKYIPSHASCGIGVKFFGLSLDCSYLIATGSSALKNTLAVGLSWTL